VNLGDTKTFGPSTVNELRLSYMRDSNNVGSRPAASAPAWRRKASSPALALRALFLWRRPSKASENTIFNSFVMGTPITNLKQANNTYGQR